MKFHLTLDNKVSVCGVKNNPDKFLYNEKGFVGHYAKEYKCKVCEKIRTTTLTLSTEPLNVDL